MSTSDPSSETVLTDVGNAKVEQTPARDMAALPDVAVIAKLANEFFSALPSHGFTPGTSSFPSVPSEAGAPTSSALPLEVAKVTPQPPSFSPPTSLPGTSAYFMGGEKSSPLGVAPSFPAASEVFTFPGVPGAHAVPGIPPLPSAQPLSEVELGSIPNLLVDVPSPKPQLPTATPPALPGSSAYFLDGLNTSPLSGAPSLPVPDAFSFPGIPGTQAIPAAPSSTTMPQASPSLPGVRESVHAVSAPSFSTHPAGEVPAAPTAPKAVEFHTLEFRPELVPDIGLAKRQFDPHMVRRDFPILQEQVNGRPLIWLDNAATTQKPNAVIDRLSYFYRHENSNIHRAAHTLAARATDAYEAAREKTRRFLNAGSTREIVFVRGTTEAINLVAKSWGHRNIQKDDEIVITWLEHHANIVPWQQLCSEKGARLRVAPVDDTGQVILEEYEKLLGPKTKLVSVSQVSNALGTITPAKKMVEMAHRHGAKALVDGAQSVSHMQVDVQQLDCDFFVFSGHKIFGPTGIGVVFGKADILDNTPPWQGGGNMIVDVTFEKTVYQVAPGRFEAGTGNIADAVGLGAALDYVSEIGLESISSYEHDLLVYGTAGLKTVPGLHLIGTAAEKAGVWSFVLDGISTEEVGKELNQEGIAVRAGHHCAQPILRRFGVETTVRPSLALYNTCEDLDALVAALHRIQASRGRG